jgi:hypothetical protein
VHVAGEVLAVAQEVERVQHAIHRADGAAGDARRQEETVGKAGPMRVHERASHLIGSQRGPTDVATAVSRASARHANFRDADGGAVHAPVGRGDSALAIEACRFREECESPALVHDDYYTRDE